eukprot:1867032-Prorocentrum_lima.AAC.1
MQGATGSDLAADDQVDCSDIIQQALASAVAQNAKVQRTVYQAVFNSYHAADIIRTMSSRCTTYFSIGGFEHNY